ncbi:MAG: ABC transporter permease [Rhizobiales bacterium]|nr:ABC transporter permease [Hyphomicrobiales bacterium]
MLRRHPSIAIGGVIVLVVFAAALLAPWLSPHDPAAQNLVARLRPPGTAEHLLGTDRYGRDVLSRVLYGARVSLIVGPASVLIASILGLTLGLAAGYVGRKTDMLIGRVFDVMLAFPSILLALAIVAALGPSLGNMILAIGLSMTPTFGRVIRSAVIGVRARDYVASARALGAGHLFTIAVHVLPNILSAVLVVSTVAVASAILVEATMSFLGLGVPPPTATWGSMVAEGKGMFLTAPWIVISAGLPITVTVFGFSLLGDGIRDWLDPRSG